MNFQEAREKYTILEQKWKAGLINQESYRAVLANLRVTDEAGQQWMMQEHTGDWFVLRGSQWVRAMPSQTRPVTVQQTESQSVQRTGSQPARPAPPPRPQRVAPRPAAKPRSSGLSIALISGLVCLCLCVGVIGGGSLLVYTGVVDLPEGVANWLPEKKSLENQEELLKIKVKEADLLAVTPNGAPQADANGVALAVPPEAVVEGEQIVLQANEIDAPWIEDIEAAVTVETPFYNVTAQGKNDSAGSLTLSFPAPSPNSRLMLVVDNEYLVELPQAPQDGKLTVLTRAAPAETDTDLMVSDADDGEGSIYYTVVTPKAGADLTSGMHQASLRADVDERNCIPDISIIGGSYINLCRQNPEGTIMVMLPTLHRDLMPQVDQMIDKMQAVMNKYADLGFTNARLSKSSPMLVRVSGKISSPNYKTLNGVLYIPTDSVQKIATQTPTDVYHEMAHWIQAVKYSMRLAYYSGERTWWLETSAENMVMLVVPEYVGSNLLTYGTISAEGSALAFQAKPYQWPGDYYVHAQLLKVNICDSGACPLTQESFARAISEGKYPLMDGTAKGKISGNLKDYAYYLLGKSPTGANPSIPLTGPVKTGEGYGEYVRITRTNNTDLKYDYNGANPQMRKETENGMEVLVIEAPLAEDGVYPLMVSGGAGNNPGLPVEVIIEPGAPFYYTIDDGDFQYSDGSKEVKIKPVHGIMGIQKVRLVAVGENGGEVFKAKVQPLSLEGAWVMMISGEKTAGGMTCSGDEMEDPNASAQLMAYVMTVMSGTGDMTADSTGRNLDWAQVPARVPPEVTQDQVTFQATALLSGGEIKYQAAVDIPKDDSSSSLPPGLPLAGVIAGLPVLWWLRRHFTPRNLRIFSNFLVITVIALISTGCFGINMYGNATLDAKMTKIEYQGGENTGVLVFDEGLSEPQGKPIWKLSGSGTFDVNFTTEVTSTDQDGNESTEANICTGSVTYPVTIYVYKDVSISIPQDDD
ncbi:MAG: hypothetical protein JW987_16885 [Anaerolineaceae bacterium]|nr:hypothetical protein [Anaerolineaceae bacterium]